MDHNPTANENCSLSKDLTVDSSAPGSTSTATQAESETAGSSYAYILFNYISF